MENKIMLITYPDSMGNNLGDLHRILNGHFSGAVGGVHILPFFPSSADRGFAPEDYTKVDEKFGTWDDIDSLSEDYYLMFDYMINHISAHSSYYKDFLANKNESEYKDLFIRYRDFWTDGEPTQSETDAIYKRKPKAPFVMAHFSDGTEEKVWCTFDDEQIDINVKTETARRFIEGNLRCLASHHASIIRLDAFAYATKKAGTSCFFIEPDVWRLLKMCEDILNGTGVTILPEIHEHYTMPLKISQKGYFIYDFALPMLMLNAIYFGNTKYLADWLLRSPAHQFTTLDTHDGIGIVDVRDLLPDDEIERTKESIFSKGANVKKVYNTALYNNLDIYQVNCTYYSACGDNDDAYLLARAVQFFAKGIPQVYYVGMLAGRNDLELLENTKVGRNINRHYYTENEIEEEIRRPVVTRLLSLMRYRNECPAFAVDGEFSAESDDEKLIITRRACGMEAVLKADFGNFSFQIFQDGKCVKI